MSDAAALVAAFKANPNRQFNAAEAEVLAAAGDKNLWAAKAAAIHYFRGKDFARAAELMRAVAQHEPSSENVKNVAVALRSLNQFDDAIEWLEAQRPKIDPVEMADLLCSLATRKGDREAAIRHGDEALALKDAAIAQIEPRAPVLRPYRPEERSRNVLAFSLWGSDPRYLRGALTNATVARYLYPGWTARFYVDSSLPEAFRRALEQNGAQLVTMDHLPAPQFGLFWRFLVEDDESVDHYVVRDCDSVINVQERWAVADWLKSDKAFHVMRDSSQHSELMLAGMWGAHRGNVGDMEKRVRAFVAASANVANYRTADQHFLRREIWPLARGSVCIHDSHFNFMSPRRFSDDVRLPRWMHVGQNDWVHYKAKA